MQDLTSMKFGLEKKKFLKPNKSVHIKKFKKKKSNEQTMLQPKIITIIKKR